MPWFDDARCQRRVVARPVGEAANPSRRRTRGTPVRTCSPVPPTNNAGLPHPTSVQADAHMRRRQSDELLAALNAVRRPERLFRFAITLSRAPVVA